jgi:capsular polysaccharide biosynthesis protein
MRVRFDFLHLENLVDRIAPDPTWVGSNKAFTALGGGLAYRELIPNEPLDPDTSCLLGLGGFGEEMARTWRQVCQGNQFQPSGSVELRNMVSFGSRGLLLDLERKVALVGGALNWGIDYARYYVSSAPPQYRLALNEDQNGFEADLPDAIPVEPRPGLLMMSPGQDIYGHWLLDYAPRLMLAGLMHGPEVPRYHFHTLPRWAGVVLAAFGVPASAIVVEPRPDFLRYQRAAMPSATKIGFRVGRPINRMAWLRLRHMLLDMPIAAEERARLPGAARIFISRKGWGSARIIGNADRLEEIALDRGFIAVRPEEFSVPAQARIFRQARVVLGEDGSGLHNIIFSEPGCLLGVVAVPDRINLWHMAICQHLGHRLCYAAAQIEEGGGRMVDETVYNQMIDRLLDAGSRH